MVRPLAIVVLLAACLAAACRQPPGDTAGGEPLPPGAPSVQLFVEPDEGVQPVVRFIASAHQSLDVAMYLLNDRDVMTALLAAGQRGVRVRVMLEEHPYGEGPGNGASYERLKGGGLRVAWSPATFRLSHDKYAIADRKVALVGTANWTHAAFTSNREYLVEDTDATDVTQLAALFDADWNRSAVQLQDPNLVVSPLTSRTRVASLIETAQREIELETEELQDAAIIATLGRAARRGVTVRAIVAAPTEGADANRPGRERLVAEGAQVRVLRQPYVHAKDIVVDGREAFVGSENISSASLDENREVGLLIGDPTAIHRLTETFDRDWQAALVR